MKVNFNTVIPHPLNEAKFNENSVWNNCFEINNGQKVMLNASSGKGKSTFTYFLFGLRNDYKGKIFFNEQNIRDLSINDWVEIRKNKLSVVFQDLQLFPQLTVKQNLVLKNNLTNSFTEEEIFDFVAQLDIKDKWEQKCSVLSMGQQQRVAIIRALLQPFELLIMDEPFSHLDDENASGALDLINTISDKNKAGFILTSLEENVDFQFDKMLYL